MERFAKVRPIKWQRRMLVEACSAKTSSDTRAAPGLPVEY